MPQSRASGAFNAPQGRLPDPTGLAPHTTPSALLRDRFLTELAYYQADQPHLSVDKCAARCRWLSQLLTAAVAAVDGPDQHALQ